MNNLGGVSQRAQLIYDRFYADREAQRFKNLYQIFEHMAGYVDASKLGVKLEIDYLALAEIVRSYFFDTIRYKEYHFDPKQDTKTGNEILARIKVAQIRDVDPLSGDWAELVHKTTNINASKVAAYTTKWILKYKPISVISERGDLLGSNMSIDGQTDFLSNINEHFAFQCALVALDINHSAISPQKVDEIIYCFRFRSFDESAYFMILSADYLCGPHKA